ncbi:tRNA (cytosine(34)-C(5))-methyltransferase, mitochondrial isoform X2 [Amia ocellicauda]|uniref:tRNA (cytosine(34)-C(5))-methyltransferase, mitochondrial isoform X2 n=1 Tax=Amia ocellicauda TaxID=2972642 RepID=UPI0034639B73
MLSAVCARGGGHAPHVPRGAARRLHAQAQRGPGQRRLCEPVLQLFDRQYSEELGPLWTTAREVLCQPQCWQYAVMLNRFCASAELQPRLRALGYSGLLPPASSPLRCFVHPAPLRLPSQRHRPGQLKPYFLLNAASLLPVLALGAADGESVLDLCSAPGGKAVAVMQSATPGLLLCNEWDGRRWKWLAETLESFIPARFSHAVQVSNRDGRVFGRIAEGLYDKVGRGSAEARGRARLLHLHSVPRGERRRGGGAAALLPLAAAGGPGRAGRLPGATLHLRTPCRPWPARGPRRRPDLGAHVCGEDEEAPLRPGSVSMFYCILGAGLCKLNGFICFKSIFMDLNL